MLYDAKLSQTMADELLKKGIYVFFFPCSTKDKARIRVQLSAAHTKNI
jgi:glycine C-acetyltransferase